MLTFCFFRRFHFKPSFAGLKFESKFWRQDLRQKISFYNVDQGPNKTLQTWWDIRGCRWSGDRQTRPRTASRTSACIRGWTLLEILKAGSELQLVHEEADFEMLVRIHQLMAVTDLVGIGGGLTSGPLNRSSYLPVATTQSGLNTIFSLVHKPFHGIEYNAR